MNMTQTGHPSPSRAAWRKPVTLIALLAAALLLAHLLGIRERLGELRGWIASLGNWGPVAFVLIHAAAVVAALPGSLLTLAGGALFGVLNGVLLVSLASTLGASLAFLIAFFNQLSGINFILYYAPEILQKARLAEKESLLNSIYIGGVNLLFTFVGLYLIDRLGRKTLLLIGSIGYIISLGMVSYCFYASAEPFLLLVFLLMFIASHAIGQGAVIWVFIAEIFPNKVRAIGQSFGASVHWVFAAVITLITPVFLDEQKGLLKDDPWIIFAFFAGIAISI